MIRLGFDIDVCDQGKSAKLPMMIQRFLGAVSFPPLCRLLMSMMTPVLLLLLCSCLISLLISLFLLPGSTQAVLRPPSYGKPVKTPSQSSVDPVG